MQLIREHRDVLDTDELRWSQAADLSRLNQIMLYEGGELQPSGMMRLRGPVATRALSILTDCMARLRRACQEKELACLPEIAGYEAEIAKARDRQIMRQYRDRPRQSGREQ